MASIFAAPPSQLVLSSRRPGLNHKAVLPSIVFGVKFHPNSFPIPSSRYSNTTGLELRQRSFSKTASNSIEGENSSSKATTTSDAQGPPFLTILAAMFVFSLLLWIITSSVTSLTSLVVKLISTN